MNAHRRTFMAASSVLALGTVLSLTGCGPDGLSVADADGNTSKTPAVDKSGRPGTRIEVSLATQKLVVYEDGQVAMRMRAIVGSPKRPTPIMQDRISAIKFAPEWNPPKRILQEDLYPEVRRNPRFLYRNWSVYQGSKKIDPKTVNWKEADLTKYRFVQDSGSGNALGSMRFTMHNNQAIFIHDTPFKARFGQEDRYASSGCIRVEQAGRLADWMLKRDGQPRSRAEIQELKKGPTKVVTLKKSVPVFVDAA